ncbi:MAG: hypothetical protein ACYCTY_12455 [Sulfuricella sp.]
MKIILRRSLTGWRIAVDWMAGCAWNQRPNGRGIRKLLDQKSRK